MVLLDGIDIGALRGDLVDRSIFVELEPISPGRRQLDIELRRRFEEAWPSLLAGLLDLAVAVLAAAPSIKLDRPPRMADFAAVLAAVDTATGWSTLEPFRRRDRHRDGGFHRRRSGRVTGPESHD